MDNYCNKITSEVDSNQTLTLPYDIRQKSRFKSQLDAGGEVSVMLPRGSSLKHGDVLQSESGKSIRIVAALEKVSIVKSSDQYLLMRICYHLGNRHVPLQIEKNEIVYQCDHVLDEMVIGLGVIPTQDMRAFEPEAGAYAHH